MAYVLVLGSCPEARVLVRSGPQTGTVDLPATALPWASLVPQPWSCFMQRKTKPPPQRGLWDRPHCPQPPEHIRKVPSPGSWRLRNYLEQSSDQSPRLLSGGSEGNRTEGLKPLPSGRGLSQFITFRSVHNIQFQVG